MTRDVLLTGTPVPEPRPRILRAGKLAVTYDAGALRRIRWNGVEVMRAILFLVRTPGWGTASGDVSRLVVEENDDGFEVGHDVRYGEVGQGVAVAIRFAGSADGTLRAEATIRAETPFETNRTGFVVLHPLDGFAATEVRVDHASGPARTMTMPSRLSPGQPVMDIAAITHRPVEGLAVETRFEGDVFEMEDQRQWSDASFKTYSRPIGLSYPYELSPDEPIEQAVAITITDTGASAAVSDAIDMPRSAGQRLPCYALPLERLSDVDDALEHLGAIRALAPKLLLLRHEARRDAGGDLAPLARLLKETGADLELQAILVAASDGEAEEELASLAKRLSGEGIAVSRVSAFAKVDEQSFQPGESRPPHPSEAAIGKALVRHFPRAKPIGGTPAFFTELNRKRPDPALWQGLTFATAPVVHAADDASVMETLESLPHILASATALADGLPLSIGPTGIGMRLNPYGPAPTDNDPAAREEMAARDPRQRGLFAAAWSVGYLARIALYALERFAFGAPTGPFGLISSAQAYARPVWDEVEEGALFPLYHVARWIASAGGATLVGAGTEGDVARVLWRDGDRRRALVANLSAETRPVPDLGLRPAKAILLDADHVLELARQTAPPVRSDLPDRLDAYAVLYLTEGDEA